MKLGNFKTELARLVQSTNELPMLWRSETDALLTPYGCYERELPNIRPRPVKVWQKVAEQMQGFNDPAETPRNQRLEELLYLFHPLPAAVYKMPRPDQSGTFDLYLLARWNAAPRNSRPNYYWYGIKTFVVET